MALSENSNRIRVCLLLGQADKDGFWPPTVCPNDLGRVKTPTLAVRVETFLQIPRHEY